MHHVDRYQGQYSKYKYFIVFGANSSDQLTRAMADASACDDASAALLESGDAVPMAAGTGDMIALRTRTKLSLVDVHMDTLEAFLPDFVEPVRSVLPVASACLAHCEVCVCG